MISEKPLIMIKLNDSIQKVIDTIMHYGLIVVALVAGYFIGNYSHKLTPTPPKQNPYTKIYSLNDISIAVNESNDLLMIEKKTGEYIIYSDSVGNCIFKMYANKIYHQTNTEVK